MRTRPIVPAQLGYTEAGVPYSPHYQDIYHPDAGAFTQARQVFLGGSGLPRRWQQHDRFVVLETGFGLGNNFLATWDAWRQDPARCGQLHFISVEQHPLSADELRQVHRSSPVPELANELIEAWPPLTPNLHRLSLEGGQVQLLLALGDVSQWLPELVAQVDAFYLDGFAPAKNPQMWEPRLFKALGRLAAPGATAATWTTAPTVREDLATAGFEVQLEADQGGKRDITLATYAPAFTPKRAPSRRHAPVSTQRHAVIVGAGLAGCSAAWALAEQGWSTTVLDRQAAPAQETSGNPAGLFHGIVNGQDGTHARFNRAAALEAARSVRHALTQHGVHGAVDGLLRLEGADADAHAMQDLLDRLGLPSDYVEAVSATQASALCGLALAQPAWFYPDGGWVQPGGLARSYLARAGARTEFRGGVVVDHLQRTPAGWVLWDAQQRLIANAEVIVLANAGDALRLLGHPAWPMGAVRGQISLLDHAQAPALPRLPIAGAGYLLPEVDGCAVFGATSQAGDLDLQVRVEDHAANLLQVERLSGMRWDVAPEALSGRTGWRWTTSDRLPVIGAVPDEADGLSTRAMDQPRFVPRVPGLFVYTALGSRGITWSALGAQVLASAITGAPSPLESGLLDAIDPARFLTRAVRRQSGAA